jgi:asparagine synthase (glutamine-hydrolysing)
MDLPGHASGADCQIVFDGILQDPARLGARLGTGQGGDPADMLMEAYLRRGDGIVEELDGVFALVIWDGRHGCLVCARDRVGMHPLFWAETRRGVVVSPSIDALIAYPGVSRELNRPALADHLAQRWPVPEETYFAGIRRVLAGHILRLAGDQTGLRRYWTPAVPRPASAERESRSVERFESLFEEAIARHLRLGPSAIFLSGGLDSVSIAAMATDVARQQGLPVPQALSLAFPGPECDESAVQASVAAQLGLPQVMLPFEEAAGPGGLFWSALEMCRTWPVPMMNVWRPAYHRLAQEGRQRGCAVILSGTGGDEWLTVELSYMADLLRAGDLVGAARFQANLLRSFSNPPLAMVRHMLWPAGLRPLVELLGRRVLRRTAPDLLRIHRRRNFARNVPDWLAPGRDLRQRVEERIEQTVDQLMQEAEPTGRYGFYLRGSESRFLRANRAMDLEEDFEAGRRLGARVLMPYWDAALVDCLSAIPPEVLNRRGRSKGIVREMVDRRFPGLGFERQKKVDARETYLDIVRTQGPRAWKRMGGLPALADLGIVEGRRIDSVVEAGLGSEQPRAVHRVWELLNLESWVRGHC